MIAFKGFSKRYGSVEAVNNLNVTIERGEVVALLGPNGSGKTTTIKAAAGLVRPSAGSVLIGSPGRPAIEPAAREASAFLPQNVAFPDSLTGLEVLDFYTALRGCSHERRQAVLALTGLNGSSRRAVATYSGGMIQRLGLAVAMLPESPVLLLDEPTAALDPDGLCAFYECIETNRARRQTILFSSHQMGDVERLANRFLVLVGGRLVASLTASELSDALANRGVMKITMDAPAEPLLAAIRARVPRTQYADGRLIVPSSAELRAEILDLVRNAGIPIRGLAAEDGRLDAFYRELVAGRH